MKYSKIVFSVITTLLISTFFCVVISQAPVAAVSSACNSDAEVLYIRGSGQLVDAVIGEEGYQKERDALKTELDRVLGADKYRFTELKKGVGGIAIDYPATAVAGNLKDWTVGGAAVVSRGHFGLYASSLNSGVELVVSYLQRATEDSGTCVVLAGYSQGAHVIGEALERGLLDNVKDRIIYIGLLGDPKLDTQGYGSFLEYGKYTPWYRGNVVPFLQSGLLGSRRPDYLPRISPDKKEAFTKVGSWCYDDDLICTSNFAGGIIDNGHSKYSERAIPQMALEIVNAIAEKTRKPIARPQCGAIKQDVVLAVNMSATMRSDRYFLTNNGIKKVVDGTFGAGCDVRAGLVVFGEKGVDTTRPVLDFTRDRSALTEALASFADGTAQDFIVDKVDIMGGVSMAMDYTWRTDAGKAIVVISDGPGDNYTTNFWGLETSKLMSTPEMRNILQKSRALGGVEVYASRMVHPSSVYYQYPVDAVSFYVYMDRLVALTAGSFSNSHRCNSCSWLDVAYDFQALLASKPTLSVPPIRVKQGETVRLTAHDISAGVIQEMSRPLNYPPSYEWYVDCAAPEFPSGYGLEVTFVANKVGTCYGGVLAKGNSWAHCNVCYNSDPYSPRAVTTFPIEILPANYTPPPLPSAVRDVTKEYVRADQILRVSWQPPENADDVGKIAYVIKDGDGNVVGVTTATKLHITGVKPNDIPVVTVSTASANGVSEATSTQDAADLTMPETAGAVLTANDINTLRALSAAPSEVRSIAVTQPISAANFAPLSPSFSATLPNITTAPQTTPLTASHTPAQSSSPGQQSWLHMTVIAVPVVLLASLGIAAKYGLLFKLKT